MALITRFGQLAISNIHVSEESVISMKDLMQTNLIAWW
jgi:hypothetical protein